MNQVRGDRTLTRSTFANILPYCAAGAFMWVVSQVRLREFWMHHPRAEEPLRMWYGLVSAASWAAFADVRALFPSADLVGNCTVFNISGNRFRLVARIFFGNHKVYVLGVMTHVEYDRSPWVESCRCHEPQPNRAKMRRRAR